MSFEKFLEAFWQRHPGWSGQVVGKEVSGAKVSILAPKNMPVDVKAKAAGDDDSWDGQEDL